MAVAALLLCAISGSGCGLSGGSVPVGRPQPGRVVGVVVRADAPDTPVADAVVTIEESSGRQLTAVSDASGKFTVEGVTPGPITIRAVSMTETPSSGTVVESARVEARAGEGVTVSVLLAVAAALPKPPDGGGPLLPPETLELRVGEQALLPAPQGHEPGPSGQPPLAPSWVVEGGVGTIGPGGVFTATTPGIGTIRVIFDGGEGSQSVHVAP